MSDLKLVHRGSTKDVYKSAENFLFKFSDRYSVFDWGEMPDHLERKGIALARFTKVVYQKLQERGVRHHLLNVPCAENEIIVKPYEVIRHGLMPQKENIFIP